MGVYEPNILHTFKADRIEICLLLLEGHLGMCVLMHADT